MLHFAAEICADQATGVCSECCILIDHTGRKPPGKAADELPRLQ